MGCCWTPSFLLLTYAWCRVGKCNCVPLGLLANFVIQGGIMGTSFALVLNTTLIVSWHNISPTCNPMEITMTLPCNVAAAVMWILTPGLVEETFKSVWLFFRLRRSVDDVPATCCFCLPASRSFNGGCWYKLAPSPYHVVLCTMQTHHQQHTRWVIARLMIPLLRSSRTCRVENLDRIEAGMDC